MRQPKSHDLNKLVSLTFDENPQVRVQAAESLGGFDDPAALFALAELSFDKEPRVRDAALNVLNKKKDTQKEVMSFAEIFASKDATDKPDVVSDASQDRKDKILRPITRLFERHLGKEKAELVKSKMMPSIEKVYLSQTAPGSSREVKEESGRKAMQEFLTSYLEVVSDINSSDAEGQSAIGAHREEGDAHPEELQKVGEELAGELGEVSTKERQVELLSQEIQEVENVEVAEIQEEKEVEKLPNTFLKKAYEAMMLSGGEDDIMKQEMKRMLDVADKDIRLAFRLAKKKFKETNITNITKIRSGMRNINTESLLVKSVEEIELQKARKQKSVLTRMLVADEEGNEGVVCIPDGRGAPVKPGMKIMIRGGLARTFESSGETALTLGRKGCIYIVL